MSAGFLSPGDKDITMTLKQFQEWYGYGSPYYRVQSGVDAVIEATVDQGEDEACYYWYQRILVETKGSTSKGLPKSEPWHDDIGKEYPSQRKGKTITMKDHPGWGPKVGPDLVKALIKPRKKENDPIIFSPPPNKMFDSLNSEFLEYHYSNKTEVKISLNTSLMFYDPAKKDPAKKLGRWVWGVKLTYSEVAGKKGSHQVDVKNYKPAWEDMTGPKGN